MYTIGDYGYCPSSGGGISLNTSPVTPTSVNGSDYPIMKEWSSLAPKYFMSLGYSVSRWAFSSSSFSPIDLLGKSTYPT